MSKGIFVWFDYMADDVDEAIAFYGETAGWKTKPWGDEEYQMWMISDDEAVGGVMQMPESPAAAGAPPHWMASISCADADATAARCQQLGGRVLREPFDIPGVGRSAILKDPQGAIFGVVALDGEMTPASPDTPGAFAWAELMTTDWEAGWAFYEDVFGWDRGEPIDIGDMGTYQLFETNSGLSGGMMNMPEGAPVPHWLYYIATDDLDAAITRVKANGGELVHGPMEVMDGRRIAVFNDSQGGAFALAG